MHNNNPVTEREREYDDSRVLESITDCQGIIEEVNDAFCEVSGYRREELIGRNHHIVRHPDMPDVAFEDLWLTLREGETWRGIVKNRCKNGDYYWADETITPLYENGRLSGFRATQIKPSPRQIDLAGGLYRHLREHSHPH
jgi:PAS domain S-box-containing protein